MNANLNLSPLKSSLSIHLMEPPLSFLVGQVIAGHPVTTPFAWETLEAFLSPFLPQEHSLWWPGSSRESASPWDNFENLQSSLGDITQ